ncbi:hypothetical protein C8J57DRAFT_1246669 [Mycena rebaudengoi]|nr:hypothetical protein C8J57DRAFT_1246669 [Mycena rebaudengoi]
MGQNPLSQETRFRHRFGHFLSQILIRLILLTSVRSAGISASWSLGRRTLEKTTLLKKVCNSIEDPEIFNPSGELRGEHDIENELMFKSNPGYIFHDSRGFESGSASEVERVKAFISDRSWTGDLPKQIHAIWYCLPADTTRSLTKADDDFFNTDMRGRDKPLEQTSFSAVCTCGETGSNCNELIEKGPQAPSLTPHSARCFESAQPKQYHVLHYVCHWIDSREDSGLVQKTTVGTMHGFLPASQRIDHLLQESYASKKSPQRSKVESSGSGSIIRRVSVSTVMLTSNGPNPNVSSRRLLMLPRSRSLLLSRPRPHSNALAAHRLRRSPSHSSETKDALNAVVAEFYPDLKWRIYTMSLIGLTCEALCICAEQTFSEASIKTREEVPNAFATALRAYVGSPTQAAVNKEIQELPRWMVHLTPMRGILKRSLPGRVVRIILSHPLRLNTVIDGSNRPPMLP